MGMGMALYLIMWVDEFYINQAKARNGRLLQVFLLVVVGFGICTQRMIQNKHHPIDVLVGAIIGVMTALCAWRYSFHRNPKTLEYEIRGRGEGVGGGNIAMVGGKGAEIDVA